MYDYPIFPPSNNSPSAEQKFLVANEQRSSNPNEVPTVSFSSTSNSFAGVDPKPVTSVEIQPRSSGLESARSDVYEPIEPIFSRLNENTRRPSKNGKATTKGSGKTNTIGVGKPPPSTKSSRTEKSSEAEETKLSNASSEDSTSIKIVSKANDMSNNKSHDETFTKNESEFLSKTGNNTNTSDQASNTVGPLYSSVPRPLSPIEPAERKSTSQVQDAAVQCTSRGARKPVKSSATNAKKVAKQMPDVFERLYPKRPSSSTTQGGIASSSVASCDSTQISVPDIKDITLNSVNILKESSNPPPLYLSSTNNTTLLGKTKNSETSTSLQTSDVFKDSLKLNLNDLSFSADTSNTVNASESLNESETLKWKLKNLPKFGSKAEPLKYGSLGVDASVSADTTESSFANKAFSSSQDFDLKATQKVREHRTNDINEDEEYEIVRRRLLDKLQQFRLGDRPNNGEEESREYGAVRDFKGAPKELSGRWANVRERLEEETERVSMSPNSFKYFRGVLILHYIFRAVE